MACVDCVDKKWSYASELVKKCCLPNLVEDALDWSHVNFFNYL